MRERGIERLYSHQVAAIQEIRQGRHVILAAGTAAGKSLCFQVPILESVLAFEFPDFLSDEAAGKTTLLVRLGRRRGAALHNAALLLAMGLAVAGTFLGLPAQVAVAVIISSPLALLQIVNLRRMMRGDPVSFNRLTFLAVTIFALTTYFMAFSYWALNA